MTHRAYTETNGISQRTAAYRFGQCGVGGYSADTELAPEQLDALNARFGGAQKSALQNRTRKTAQRSVFVPVSVAPQNETETVPQKSAQSAQSESAKNTANKDASIIFYASFAVAFISMALTCAGMYMIAWLIGLGLGLMFSLFMLVSVVTARNAETGDTSREALNTVLYLELGACMLHPYTFFTAFEKMGVRGEWYVLALAAVGCSVGVAVLSYNSVKLIRNYYAELKQAKEQ